MHIEKLALGQRLLILVSTPKFNAGGQVLSIINYKFIYKNNKFQTQNAVFELEKKVLQINDMDN